MSIHGTAARYAVTRPSLVWTLAACAPQALIKSERREHSEWTKEDTRPEPLHERLVRAGDESASESRGKRQSGEHGNVFHAGLCDSAGCSVKRRAT